MEAKRSHEMRQPGALKYNIKDLFQAGRDVSSHLVLDKRSSIVAILDECLSIENTLEC